MKSYDWLDLAVLYADISLEILRRRVNEQIPELQMWLFIQNQKIVHGVDVTQFCGCGGSCHCDDYDGGLQ